MRQKSMPTKDPAENAVRDIRRKTRKQYSAEEKIRIGLEGPCTRPRRPRSRAELAK